jgi:hypothetical protein
MTSLLLPDRSVNAPLLIHRWFADGAMLKVADELKPLMDLWNPAIIAIMNEQTELLLQLKELDCGLLVLSKTPDPDCPDPLARDRGPTILRCCLLTEQQLRRISVDRTAAIHLAALLLQNAHVPEERQSPCPLFLQIPVCEPDFRHPIQHDPDRDSFQAQVLADLETQRQQLEYLLKLQPHAAENPIPETRHRSWWRRMFNR